MNTVAKKNVVVGITIKSKEDYDRLMEKHSVPNTGGMFCINGIDFKGLFRGYPEEDQYPCLVEYYIGSMKSLLLGSFSLQKQFNAIIEDGYSLRFYVDES